MRKVYNSFYHNKSSPMLRQNNTRIALELENILLQVTVHAGHVAKSTQILSFFLIILMLHISTYKLWSLSISEDAFLDVHSLLYK